MGRTVGVCSTSKKLSSLCLEGLLEDILIKPGRLRLVKILKLMLGELHEKHAVQRGFRGPATSYS